MKWGLYIINRDMHATSYAPYPSSKWALLPTKKALRAIQNVLYALKWGVYIIKKDMHGTSYAPYLSSKYNCKAPHNKRVLLSMKWGLFANTYSPYAFKWALYTINSFMRDMTHSRVTWLIHTFRCIWMSHVTYECDTMTWLDRSGHMTHSCVTWPIHTCFLTHARVKALVHVWHDSFHVRQDSFMCDRIQSCVTWLIHVRQDSIMLDLSHSRAIRLIQMWYDSFICDVSHSRVASLFLALHDLFVGGMTHSCVISLFRS